MAKKISILGSTGSIGVQTLEAAENLGIEVLGLSANSNTGLLYEQALKFKPKIVAIMDEDAAVELSGRLKNTGIEVYKGPEGINNVAAISEADTVVVAIVGIAGLVPTMKAIECGKDIALANKETLVTAGEIVMSETKRRGVKILPLDSEHSAIFQCLAGNNIKEALKIILTASGGPFRGKTRDDLADVTVEQALNHPNWSMGAKITIDSSTLMNKGLEVIEARWLFDIPQDRIQVVVHPQSIIHSMVEYTDGSVMAQLGPPDMRIPIQYALSYPSRLRNRFSRMDLLKVGKLTFEEPDYKAFPCLRLAFDALDAGGTMPVVLNAANEKAVELFLKKEILFNDIPNTIERAMESHKPVSAKSIADILEADRWARKFVEEKLRQKR